MLAYHVPGRTGSRIVIAELATGKRKTVRREHRALLTNPSLAGGRLLYVRSVYTRQELRLGPQTSRRPRRDRRLWSMPPTGRRDAGHEPGKEHHKHGWPRKLWPRPKRGLSATLWTTALAADVAYVTAAAPGLRRAARGGDPARGALARRVGVSFQRRNFRREGYMRRSAGLLAVAAVVTALLSAPAAQGAEKTPTAVGRDGAAATVDTLATKAAIKTLRRGGNAVDAAVTAAGVLGVVEPFSCGIGGGGFMVIRDRKGNITTIDHREKAPAAMTPTSFWQNGAALAFDPARYSGMSAGVPGTALGWERALDRYGTISLRKALKPGARIARRGFVVDQVFRDQIAGNGTYFNDVPSTAELYLDSSGQPLAVGTRVRNPDLAATYERVGRLGAERGFYRGPIADAIVAATHRPADRRPAGAPVAAGRDDGSPTCATTPRRSARRRRSPTAGSTSTAWARRRAAARPTARR